MLWVPRVGIAMTVQLILIPRDHSQVLRVGTGSPVEGNKQLSSEGIPEGLQAQKEPTGPVVLRNPTS
jgi:hypothetical protein